MNPTLNSKSWHFWLANFCAENNIWDTDTIDICKYTRRVVRGIFLLAVFGIIVAVFGFTTLYSIGNVFSVIFLDGYEMQPITWFMMILYSIVGYCVFRDYQDTQKRKQPKIAKDPGFLTLAYRKFKEKTCFMVNFK